MTTLIPKFEQTGSTVNRPFNLKLQESVSVKDFGAVGNGTTDDTTAIQNAVNATPYGGTLYFPAGQYKLTNEIRLPQPITILGAGEGQPFNGIANTATTGCYVYQSNTAKNAFTLVAGLNNYTFAQYGICGINFQNIQIIGSLTLSGARAQSGIGVDTTINGGDFHIRGNSMTNCIVKFFTTGVNFVGIAYLNNFFNCIFQANDTGFSALKGSSSTQGGQTRFFGCTFDFNTKAIEWYQDTVSGADLYISGCTIADGSYGIACNSESPLTIIGSHFESLSNGSGGGYGIYIFYPVPPANPNSEGPKYINGNNFNSNDKSIWFDLQSSSAYDGVWCPTHIDCNVSYDPIFVQIQTPANVYLDTASFVLGASNVGTNNARVASSQLVGFAGINMVLQRITRRFVFNSSYSSGIPAIFIPIGFIPLSIRFYLTANSSGFTALTVYDQTGTAFTTAVNGQTQTLNTWVSWTPVVPEITATAFFNIQGTNGMLGAQGVLEIDGYVPG